MEEKYLSLKYPSYATNFVATESSNKDLLKTHQVDFGTTSGWDSTSAFPHPSELYEMVRPFFQEEVRRQMESFKSQILDQIKGMLGIIIQSSLDDVYKDIGRVTDNLSSRVQSLKKSSGGVKAKIEHLE